MTPIIAICALQKPDIDDRTRGHQFMRNTIIAAIGLVCTTLALPVSATAQTTSFPDFINISGQIRSYYFSRLTGSPTKDNQNAYSLGGILNVSTAPVPGGFSATASLFYANSLGINGRNNSTIDSTLMGTGPTLASVGQAYLQYRNRFLLLRAGDQIIKTPWMGPRDSRMFPQTYQGVYLAVKPVKNLTLVGTRIFAWQSRTSSRYAQDNLYYATQYQNDDLYGTEGVLPKNAAPTSGTLAFGATYKTHRIDATAWYYNFYQFARMFYTQGTYDFAREGTVTPFVSGQFLREWSGAGMFSRYSSVMFNQPGHDVNTTLEGIEGGVDIPHGKLFLGYDVLQPHPGAFGGGALVSPYENYKVMYASFMSTSLVTFGPGHAIALGADYTALDHRLTLMGAIADFNTYYSGDVHALYASVQYRPTSLRNLSIRDRMVINKCANNLCNQTNGYGSHDFIYNRVMLAYRF